MDTAAAVDKVDRKKTYTLVISATGGLSSGLLIGLSFRYPQLALIAWFGLVPLLVALHRSSFRAAVTSGAVFGAAMFGTIVYWFYIFGLPAVAGILLYGALFGVAFCVGTWWVLRRLPAPWRVTSVPALLVVLEWLRSSGSWGFGWGVLGYTQQPIGAVAQFASVAGVLGISAALGLVNAVMAEIVVAPRGRRRILTLSAVPLAVVGGLLAWGMARQAATVGPPTVLIAGVQPSIDQWAKFDPEQAASVIRVLRRLSAEALESEPFLLIWPETAVPIAGEEARLFLDGAAREAQRAGADFLYGAFESDGGGLKNSAVLVNARGERGTYGKVHLVPFGEYVPLRPLLGNVGMLTLVRVDLSAARRPVLLPSSFGPVASVICFESTDAALVRRAVNMGAGFLVVITNDGWFKETDASGQHFRMTSMRAIENGTYVAQVSNNGISGVIDPRGRVTAATRLWDRTVLRGSVGVGAEATPYRRYGDLPLLALAALVLGLGALPVFSAGSASNKTWSS